MSANPYSNQDTPLKASVGKLNIFKLVDKLADSYLNAVESNPVTELITRHNPVVSTWDVLRGKNGK